MLQVKNLKKTFHTGYLRKRPFNAVDEVSFSIAAGETLGLIGESGCGKSTLGRMIMQLIPPTSGQIIFQGNEINGLNGKELKQLRKQMQIIFQSPQSALNPHLQILNSVCEPMQVHGYPDNKEEQIHRAMELMEMVGLNPHHLYCYPHELSGGQIQRVVLARILSLQPKFIVADEPTSMLDVSVQAQILQLLHDIKKEQGIACLFISHDLDVVQCMSERIAVMYQGQIVEIGRSDDIFQYPLHPYTKILVDLFTSLNTKPTILDCYQDNNDPDHTGCSFYYQCPRADKGCLNRPGLNEIDTEHYVSCFKI